MERESLKILWRDLIVFYRIPENFAAFYAAKTRAARAAGPKPKPQPKPKPKPKPKTSTKISLRLIEYLLTNYVLTGRQVQYIVATKDANDDAVQSARPRMVQIRSDPAFETEKTQLLNDGWTLKLFDLRREYEKQITTKYHKKLFDPCCRGKKSEKFVFKGKGGQCETTLRQLVFFRWAIENCVLTWLATAENAAAVAVAMRDDESAKKAARLVKTTSFRPRLETLQRKRQRLTPKSAVVIRQSCTTSISIDA